MKKIIVNQDATNGNRLIKILLAEDNLGDVFLIKKALAQSKLNHQVTLANDGQHLMSILNMLVKDNADLPDLILLDINMPKKNGKEALAEIKSDRNLKKIPVMVFTSSKDMKDISEAYELHANSYLVKPISLEEYRKVVETIENFWLSTVVLPNA
jgi:CheY-like chemotaxis protein